MLQGDTTFALQRTMSIVLPEAQQAECHGASTIQTLWQEVGLELRSTSPVVMLPCIASFRMQLPGPHIFLVESKEMSCTRR